MVTPSIPLSPGYEIGEKDCPTTATDYVENLL